MSTRDEALKLIEFLKSQDDYQDLFRLRLILQSAANILYQGEKNQLNMDFEHNKNK